MKTLKPLLTFMALLALPLVAAAASDRIHGPHYPDVVTTIQAIETGSDIVLLPGSETGMLTVNYCAGCKAATLAVNRDTNYYLGTEKVPLAELKRFLSDGRVYFMTVFASVKERVALRVVVAAPPVRRPQSR